MKLRHLLLAGAALALPAAATAQTDAGDRLTEGAYVGAQTGVAFVGDQTLRSASASSTLGYGEDWTGLLEAGYRFGSGLRLGGEFSYTDATVGDIIGGLGARTGSDGDLDLRTYMGVVAYEVATDSNVRPYVALGAGVADVDYDGVGSVLTAGETLSDNDVNFAWQVGAGLAYAVTHNVEMSANYRYLDVNSAEYRTSRGTLAETDLTSHSFMIGLRYVFGAAPAPKAVQPVVQAAAAPPPPTPPAPARTQAPLQVAEEISRNFLIFFDWDSAELTPEARRILGEVVEAAKKGGIARIEIVGHADTSGATDYNQRLSERRAQVARAWLSENGLPSADIALQGRGETELLTQTADGVREPTNRRAVIVFP